MGPWIGRGESIVDGREIVLDVYYASLVQGETHPKEHAETLTFPRNSCPGRMLRFVAGWEEGEADEVQATQRRTDHLQAA